MALNTINQNLTDTEKILTRNADGGGGVKHCAYWKHVLQEKN